MSSAADRLRTAFELHELSVRMQRQRFHRDNPDVSDDNLDVFVQAWLQERPGAEHGDAAGSPSRRFT
ncbi:MAG: hypothetical protein ACR2GH_19505 [Pseudonocardia sp.]